MTTTVTSSGVSWQMRLPPTLKRRGIRLDRPYEHKLLLDIAAEQPTGCAFDVGAFWGNHAIFLAEVCGLRVHAFEADSGRVRWLDDNVALNGCDVTVHRWAVGIPGHASPVERSKSGKLLFGHGPVEIFAIDDRLDVPDLSLVKLDVEGMEAPALAGMRRHLARCRPLVYSETHDDGADQAAVLEPLGYRLERTIMSPSPMRKWRPS